MQHSNQTTPKSKKKSFSQTKQVNPKSNNQNNLPSLSPSTHYQQTGQVLHRMLLPGPKTRNIHLEKSLYISQQFYSAYDNSNKFHEESSPKFRKPYFLQKEPELLKDENIQLKQRNNQQEEKIKNLTFRLNQLEVRQELNQTNMQTQRDQLNDSINDIQTTKQSPVIVKKFFDKYKELKKELMEREAELIEYKKSYRYLKIQELEIEIESYQLETQRLVKYIEQLKKINNNQTISNKEEQILENISGQLVEDDVKIKEMIENYKNLNVSWVYLSFKKKKLTSLRWDLQQANQQKENYKRKLNEKTIELQEFKKAIEIQNQKKNSQQQQHQEQMKKIQSYKEQIEKQQAQIDSQKEQIQSMQQYVMDIEEQYKIKDSFINCKKEVKSTNQKQLDLYYKEHQIEKEKEKENETIMEKENEDQTIQSKNEDIDSRKRILLRKKTTESHIKSQKSFEQQANNNGNQHLNTINQKQQTSIDQQDSEKQEQTATQTIQCKNQKYLRVNGYDVDNLGRELRYKLMMNQINFSELDEYLINDIMYEEGEGSIRQVMEILERDPFLIDNYQNRLLLARYLIEDNTEDIIVFNEDLTNDIQIIKSVFKKVIGKYQLFEHNEVEIMKQELRQIFQKFKNALMDTIEMLISKKKNLSKNECEQEDWLAALHFCDINLNARQKEYINLSIYKQQNLNDRIKYKELLQEILDEQKEQ